MLPGVTVQDAEAVARRISERVSSLQVTSEDGGLVAPTVSIGVAPAPATGGTVTDLVASTQGMLREGKRAGKNAVVAMGARPSAPAAATAAGRFGVAPGTGERLRALD